MRRLATFIGLVGVLAGGARAQAPLATTPSLAPTTATTTVVPSATVPPGTPARPLTKADVDAWLDGFMPYALRNADIPGAVVTIVADGKILTARGFGYADRDKRTPVNPETTLFRPGSVSKLFTWTAVMQLVEAGKLNLDTDVSKYLDFVIPPHDGQPVTLRRIMTHTGGFEETAKGIIYFDPKLKLSLGDYVKRWVPNQIFTPGSTPAYSNWATALAAYIVQRAAGQPFDDYIDSHIFAPLGMKHATFLQPLPANLVADMAAGYPKPGQPSPGFEFVGPAPAGSSSVSGTDMARFMLAHLDDGSYEGNRILSPATEAMMLDSPLAKVDPRSLVPPLSRMELGFFETNLNGREVVGHLGDTEAFHTSLHLFRKEGVGLYASFNSPGKAGAVNPVRVSLFQDFADRYFPSVAVPDGRVDAKTSADHARAMAGTWWVSRRPGTTFLAPITLLGQTKIAVGPKGELVVPSIVGGGGRPRDWIEIAPYVWRDANGHDRLAAQLVDGKPVRWSYDFASPFEVFDRVPAAKSAAWIMPAIYVALGILVLTFVHWPVTAIVRRHYQARQALTGMSLRTHRATRLMAGVDVVLIVGWGVAVSAIFASPDLAAGGLDGVFMSLQVAGVIVFVGTVLVSGWNLVRTFDDGRQWPRKLWNLLVFLSAAILLYVAIAFNLMVLSVNY